MFPASWPPPTAGRVSRNLGTILWPIPVSEGGLLYCIKKALLTGLDGSGPLHANGPVVAPGHVGGLISAVGGRRQRLALERHRGAVARVDALDRIDAAVCDGLPSPKLPVTLKADLVVGTGS